MTRAASAIIHSVRLISPGLDRADAFVAFRDGRVLATGTGTDWRALAATAQTSWTAGGRFWPRD